MSDSLFSLILKYLLTLFLSLFGPAAVAYFGGL